jgi:hypothetical protein
MSAILEPPAATANGTPASAAQPGSADRLTTPPADGVANQRTGDLTLAFAAAARARRDARRSGDQGKTAKPESGQAQDPQAPAPGSTPAKGTDETNAASTPDTATEAQAGDAATPDPEATDDAMAALVAQDQPETDGEGASDGEQGPKAVPKLLKRVNKLTARLKAYEAKFGPIGGDGEAASSTAEPHAASPAPAFSGAHPDLSAIDSEVATYEAHLRWFDEHPDGGEYRNDRGELVATVAPEQVVRLRRTADRKINELLARRAAKAERIDTETAEQARRFDAQAVQRYPWLNNPNAPEHLQAQGVLAELPKGVVDGLARHPKARLLLGALVEGLKALEPVKPTPAPRSTPPKVMGAPSSAAPRVSANDALRQELTEAEAAFAKSGSTNDQKRVLTLRRQLRRAA